MVMHEVLDIVPYADNPMLAGASREKDHPPGVSTTTRRSTFLSWRT